MTRGGRGSRARGAAGGGGTGRSGTRLGFAAEAWPTTICSDGFGLADLAQVLTRRYGVLDRGTAAALCGRCGVGRKSTGRRVPYDPAYAIRGTPGRNGKTTLRGQGRRRADG